MKFLPLALHHAPLLHELYTLTPGYFALLGGRVPSRGEVEQDLQTALFDPRRRLELIYDGEALVGSLDYKLEYPEKGDVTINLLLIRGDLQSGGLGARAVRQLETRLPARARLLAGIFGENPPAVRFWRRLGFHFATDARPVMVWYAKQLEPRPGSRPEQEALQGPTLKTLEEGTLKAAGESATPDPLTRHPT